MYHPSLLLFLLATALLLAGSISSGYTQNKNNISLDADMDQALESAYPLKTTSMIYTAEDIQRARKKIEENPEARQVARKIITSAEKWLEWDDLVLMALIPHATVPRSFDLNANGCPVHGDTIFKVGGAYPWILDPRKQFQVECPVGHETYPSNDFKKSYSTGTSIPVEGSGLYFDNGWGWVAEDGEKYWFVAYSNHWIIRNEVHSAIQSLGRAYLLSGRKEFAHKALVLLYRLAAVYPAMDYEHQSRYGQMQKQNGRRYPGKVFNLIWETSFIRSAAECYDAVWDYIDQDTVLQDLVSRDGKSIQSFIEVNLLEEAVESYMEQKIQGNFGMHQMALLYVLLARQHMDNEKLIDRIINNVSHSYPQTGISYALYNFVFRDGVPMESPSYNFLWVRTLTALSNRLKKFGVNYFEDHRFQSVLKSPLRMMATEQYTVDVGDSGSTLGGVIGRDRNTYETAFANTGDTSYLRWIYADRESGRKGVKRGSASFESLFRPDFSLDPDRNSPISNRSSRLFAGYGMGILKGNNTTGPTVAMTYGLHGSHYHWDFLNFELFAFGQKMMPDFGYPDAMNTYVPGVYTWSTNTVAHNTVVVDAQKQNRNLPGLLHDFADGDFGHVISASSPAYAQTDLYHRNLVMVDTEDDQNYMVDFFYVRGGQRHDYMLHGPPGRVIFDAHSWSEPRPGTYAGEEVALAEIYDNERMGQEGYSGGYGGYRGSGFQHLFNVRKKTGGDGIVEFRHLNDEKARIKIRMLQTEGQEMYLAEAYNHPRAKEHKVRHLICHSEGGSGDLGNTFVSILEPYYKDGFITAARRIAVEGDAGSQAVRIERGERADIVISDLANEVKSVNGTGIKTDATSAIVTFNGDGLERVFFSNGSFLSYGDRIFEAEKWTGTITAVDIPGRQVTVRMDERSGSSDLENLNTDLMFFSSPVLETVHPVEDFEIQGRTLTLTTADDMLIGRINVTKLPDVSHKVRSNNALRFASSYIGAYVLNDKYEVVGRVTDITGNDISFSGHEAEIFGDGNEADIWIATIGVGDRAEWKTRLEWEK